MLIDELKRRGVLRVAALYAAAAFATIQAADIILPRLGFPDGTVTFIVIAAIAGFPLALILAWIYEVKPTAAGDVAPRPRRSLKTYLIAAGIALVASLGALLITHEPRVDPDAELIAVLPFRVAGAARELAYLREGMVDLLAAKLGGTAGVRTVDSRTILASWRNVVPNEQTDLPVRDATSVARAVGAGQMLLGEIVGVPAKLVLTASLVDVQSNRVTRAVVEGSADSLPRLVDKLAAQLLALGSGEDEYRLESLVSTSLPALRSYLQGRQTYRRGQYLVAAQHYQDALQRDSTFALASAALVGAAGWFSVQLQNDAIRATWEHRNRLPARDRVLLEAYAGPRYPAPITGRELLTGAEHATRMLPDNADAWYLFGDALYHQGVAVHAERVVERARNAFDQAIRLDSSFAAPYGHAIELAATAHDTATAQRLTAAYLAAQNTGETAEPIRWTAAALRNDQATLAEMYRRVDSIPPIAILWIATLSQERGLRPQDLPHFLPNVERNFAFWGTWMLLNAGQPKRALSLIGPCWVATTDDQDRETCDETARASRIAAARYLVTPALFEEIDTSDVAPYVSAIPPDIESLPHDQLCTLEQWRSWRGDLRTVNQSVARLNSAADISAQHCAVMLQAIAAVRGRRSDAAEAVRNLERLAADAQSGHPLRYFGNLIAARLLEETGDVPGALAAVRRRTRGLTPTVMLSTHLREEGRLAARAGDVEGARSAYAAYIALRPNPEPAVRNQVESVRRELDRLTAR